MDRISEELIDLIFDCLTPQDVFKVMRCSWYWHEYCIQDDLWKKFYRSRWNAHPLPSQLRRHGAKNMFQLYNTLDRVQYLPKGKFTSKSQIVWGKSRQEGCDSWITVAHRPDCKVIRRDDLSYIELRLVIQNIDSRELNLDIYRMQIHFKDGKIKSPLGIHTDAHQDLAPRILALNGMDLTLASQSQSVPKCWNQFVNLQLHDFVVASMHVECKDCEFEADFLEECSFIWFPLRRPGPCRSFNVCRCGLIPDGYHHGNVRVAFVDESIIWKNYTSISGGFMVLNCRTCMQSGLPEKYLI